MKKVVFIIFSAITFYCNSQEKITLTTGDTLLGKVSEIDEEHSRINKSDGTSLIVLSDMIKSINGISSTPQNDSLKNYSTENWKINFQIAPNYAYRIAKRINDDPAHITGAFPFTVNEEYNIYSWHFSVSGTKKITRRVDLNLGVIIDNQGYHTKEFQTSFGTYINVYNYRYFGLSLSSTEKLKLNDKIYLFFTNGINYYFLSQLRATDWGGNNKDDLRLANDLSVFVFAGVYYKIEKKYSLSISPFFNYFLTPLTNPQAWNGSSYQQNFFSTGVELGVHYNIGKK